jgi:ubiquinone/menaquinone biosynthesis C-methylase UbiE
MPEPGSQEFSPPAHDERRSNLVQDSFGAAAQAYTSSKVHASGPDLGWVVEAAALSGDELVVDVGTGTGHTALALAPYAREVVAVDITLPMLAEAERLAASQGVSNLRFLQADASALPLSSSQYDLVTCRQAAHHFSQIGQAVHEWARILKRGGKVVVVDSVSPQEPAIEGFLHEIEVLRDPSHGRNYRIAEWLALLADAGFNAGLARAWTIPLDIASWTRRLRTAPASVARIERLFAEASPAIKEGLQIGLNEEGLPSFELPAAIFVGVKPD